MQGGREAGDEDYGFLGFLIFFFNRVINFFFLPRDIIWQPHGTNVAATSAFNGSMDGKCNRCIILK